MNTRARLRVALFVLVLAFGIGTAWAVPSSTTTVGKVDSVVLVSWDGVQRSHLLEMLAQNRLPVLASMIASGALVSLEVTDHATDTKAGHSEMLTGLGPDATGVYSNTRFRAIPVGLTLFERVNAALGAQNVATVAVTGKQANLTEILANARASLDMASIESAAADAVGGRALSALEACKDDPFLAFFHFRDPDHAGHGSGENSAAYENAIVACDSWLGRILSKLEELGMAARTAVYVTTDHGFDEGAKTHFNAPGIWLVAEEPVLGAGESAGDQKDVAATILARFGIDPAALEPPLPGSVLAPASVVRVERNLVFATVGGEDLTLDLFLPASTGIHPAIVFIHGGGWTAGDKSSWEDEALRFADEGYVGISVNYRLAPEFPFPAAVEDCKAAVRWLRQHAAELGVDPERIGAMGSSAGGHLVSMLGVTDGTEGLEGTSGDLALSSRVQAVVDYFGPSDLTQAGMLADPAIVAFLGGTCAEQATRCAQASPVTYVSSDDPSFLIVHGTSDSRVPFNQSVILRDALRAVGVDAELLALQGAGHGWSVTSPYYETALSAAAEFFDRELGASGE